MVNCFKNQPQFHPGMIKTASLNFFTIFLQFCKPGPKSNVIQFLQTQPGTMLYDIFFELFLQHLSHLSSTFPDIIILYRHPKIISRLVHSLFSIYPHFIGHSSPFLQVEQLLIGCILDGAVKGKIDQLSNTLVLDKEQESHKLRMTSLSAWTKQIDELSEKLNVTAGGGPGMR